MAKIKQFPHRQISEKHPHYNPARKSILSSTDFMSEEVHHTLEGTVGVRHIEMVGLKIVLIGPYRVTLLGTILLE